jgi:hypothetical protein
MVPGRAATGAVARQHLHFLLVEHQLQLALTSFRLGARCAALRSAAVLAINHLPTAFAVATVISLLPVRINSL